MSLVKTAAGAEEYYIEYAGDGGEQPGEWMGGGAERLGLSGEVQPEQLRYIFKGFYPDGSRHLVKLSAIRKDYEHVPAWDLCLSPPKDVSLLAGLYEEFKPVVDKCKLEAVTKTVEFIEQQAAFTRRGSGGRRLEACKLIIARFDHHTSRNDDPQEHSHLLIANAGAHRDGFGTIVSQFIYDQQTKIQEVFLATLAIALRRELGVTIEGTALKPFEPGQAFNVAGIPDELRKLNSSRRAEILSARQRLGIKTGRGSDVIAVATRREKSHLPVAVLRPIWKKVAESIGIDLEQMKADILRGTSQVQTAANSAAKPAGETVTTETAHRAGDNVRPFTAKKDATQAVPVLDLDGQGRAGRTNQGDETSQSKRTAKEWPQTNQGLEDKLRPVHARQQRGRTRKQTPVMARRIGHA